MERFLDFAIYSLGALFALFGLLLLFTPASGRKAMYEAQRLQARGSNFKRRVQGAVLLLIGFGLFVTAFVFQNRSTALPVVDAETDPVPIIAPVEAATSVPTAIPPPTLAPVEIIAETPVPTEGAETVETNQPTEVPAQEINIEPTPAATEIPYDAFVNVVGGLNMRDSPNGRVTVLLLNGTGMFMLDEAIAAGDYLWQKVISATGEEGWVAEEFIQYSEE